MKRTTSVVAFLGVVTAAQAWACTTDIDALVSNDAGASSSSGGAFDAGASSSSGDSGAVVGSGFFSFAQGYGLADEHSAISPTLSAGFYPGARPVDPNCTTVVTNNCSFVRCPAGPGEADMSAALSAGKITVTASTGESIPLRHSTPEYAAGQLALLEPGTVLTVSATGGTVPAFEGSVTIPVTPEVVGPAAGADGGAGSVPQSVDFVVPFSAPFTGYYAVELYSPLASAYCEYPDAVAATSAILTASTLQQLPTDASYDLLVEFRDVKRLDVAGFPTQLTAAILRTSLAADIRLVP